MMEEVLTEVLTIGNAVRLVFGLFIFLYLVMLYVDIRILRDDECTATAFIKGAVKLWKTKIEEFHEVDSPAIPACLMGIVGFLASAILGGLLGFYFSYQFDPFGGNLLGGLGALIGVLFLGMPIGITANEITLILGHIVIAVLLYSIEIFERVFKKRKNSTKRPDH